MNAALPLAKGSWQRGSVVVYLQHGGREGQFGSVLLWLVHSDVQQYLDGSGRG